MIKRLFVGLLYFILMATWFLWAMPYWVITGKEFINAFIKLEKRFNLFT